MGVETYEGAKIISERFPLVEFLAEKAKSQLAQVEKFQARLDSIAGEGRPPNNPEVSRSISAEHGIFELKTHDRFRVAWFWDEGRVIICTHGFMKPGKRQLQAEIKKAIRDKKNYLEAKKTGTLVIREENDNE